MSDVENGVGGGGKHGRGGNRVVVVDFDMRFSTLTSSPTLSVGDSLTERKGPADHSAGRFLLLTALPHRSLHRRTGLDILPH